MAARLMRQHNKGEQDPGPAVIQHLAHHGLKTEIKHVPVVESDVASTLLSHAADSSADLMVMGGYGHSPLPEFVLGGVTRGILGTMPVPVLMSH
jgi:nucleotide-binding universal stress UspA family protein